MELRLKLREEDSNVIKSYGLSEEGLFNIKQSAHAFRILSSGLYSDKESAVLREIGCNAYDAHVSIGKTDIPFDVKIPNQIDNQFYIRDYGPGLSDEDIKGLYTTYFASTKQDSNDYTGAFGLGSKSPFSYTDSFTISSFHAGFCRIYSAHIGDKGSPQIALMSESETTETGISIGFPVKPQDFSAFRSKASMTFRWFKTLPNIIGGEELKPVVYALNSKDWGLTDIRGGPYVLMGNVCYKLDWAKVGDQDKLQRAICSMGNLVLKFPIGRVQVAASREELQYDPDSVKTIKDSLTSIGKSIVKTIEDSWKNRASWEDKCKFKSSIADINRGVTFDEEMYKLGDATDPKGLWTAGAAYSFKVPAMQNNKVHVILFKSNRKGMTGHQCPDNSTFSIPFNKELKIVTGTAVRAHQRTKKAIQESKLGECILIYPKKKEKGTQYDVDLAHRHIHNHTGNISTVDLVSLDAPPKIVRTKKGQLPILPVYIAAHKEQIYLPISTNRYAKVLFHGERSHWDWQSIRDQLELLRKLPINIEKEIEIPLKEIKKYKLHERVDWITFDVHVKTVLEDKNSLTALEKEVKNHKTHIELNGWLDPNSTNILQNLVLLRHKHVKWFDLIKTILNSKGALNTVEEVYNSSIKPKSLVNASAALNAYKRILSVVGSTIQQPELRDEDLGSKFPNASKLKFNDMTVVAGLSENAFITMMKEYLN